LIELNDESYQQIALKLGRALPNKNELVKQYFIGLITSTIQHEEQGGTGP
jgi:hypothetical protein